MGQWFEIKTWKNRPYKIELRRLSPEEASQAANEEFIDGLLNFNLIGDIDDEAIASLVNQGMVSEAYANKKLKPISTSRNLNISQNTLDNLYKDWFGDIPDTNPDPKEMARGRSKNDMKRKRKEMIKRGGKHHR